MLNEFIIIELVESSWPSGLSHNYPFSTSTSLPWFSVFSRYHVFYKEKLIKLISGLFSNFFEIWELLPFSKNCFFCFFVSFLPHQHLSSLPTSCQMACCEYFYYFTMNDAFFLREKNNLLCFNLKFPRSKILLPNQSYLYYELCNNKERFASFLSNLWQKEWGKLVPFYLAFIEVVCSFFLWIYWIG